MRLPIIGTVATIIIMGALFAHIGTGQTADPPPSFVCDFLGTLGHCPTATSTPSPTDTPIPTATNTSTDTPTNTSTPLPTDTATPTSTPTPITIRTYSVTSPDLGDNWTVDTEVFCDIGDVASGGGWKATPRDSLTQPFASYPVAPNGWHTTVHAPVYAVVVCIDNLPLH